MAKGQKRKSLEAKKAKKPKQPKVRPVATAPPFAAARAQAAPGSPKKGEP